MPNDLDIKTVDRLLTTTRSVRKRLDFDRPVDIDVVRECLAIAMQAPNGTNAQNWRWIVVADADKRDALADMYKRAFAPYLAMGAGESDTSDAINSGSESGAAQRQSAKLLQQDKVMDSVRYLIDNLHRVPLMVIPCVMGRPASDAPHVWVASLYGSIFPAVWSFQLALRARGLGTCLTTAHLGLESEAAELLGVPDDAMQIALLPVAHYLGSSFQPAERQPAERSIGVDAWPNPA